MAEVTPDTKATSDSTAKARPHAYFEQQRAILVDEIAVNLEAVLQNINKLNRSLEGITAVGNEFGQVEGLWSQFENVMTRDAPDAGHEGAQSDGGKDGEAQPQ